MAAMAHTARRWSGLVDLDGPDGVRMKAVRAHISQPEAAVGDGEWHGSLLVHDDCGLELLGQLVGLCTMTFGNERRCQIIVRTDGSFVGVDDCPVELW